MLQVHSISHIIETCSCLATTPTSLICCKARLVTKDFYFTCLHIIYITIVVPTNENIAVTNRTLNHYYYAFLANQKFPFYTETG